MIRTIKDDIQKAKVSGEKQKADVLSTLYAEAYRVGKDKGNRDSTNEEVVGVVKKFIKNLEETLSYLKQDDERYIKYVNEIEILNQYLPEQFTDDDILFIISGSGAKNLGEAMKYLRDNHAGQFDGKQASTTLKKVFG